MQIKYRNTKLEKNCKDIRKAIKEYGPIVGEKLIAAINFIENSCNIKDIMNYPPFRFHKLSGKRNGEYAIDLGKRLGFRLIVIPINKEGSTYNNIEDTNVEIICIYIEEVTNHYE